MTDNRDIPSGNPDRDRDRIIRRLLKAVNQLEDRVRQLETN